MKKCIIIAAVMLFGIYIFGCKQKPQETELSQEGTASMETLSAINTEAQVAPQPKVTETKAQASESAPVVASLEVLPPAGPYKPTARQIQLALKNSGFYRGAIDGKLGPISKKAIAEFQKANGLEADGKVGPKTWVILSKHLQAQEGQANP